MLAIATCCMQAAGTRTLHRGKNLPPSRYKHATARTAPAG
eukprot:COSAG01_NODE_47810_length_386_cov_13.177700_1_plen_39_part_10